MFTETGNVPAKVIKQFRAGGDKPALKAAYIDSAIYVGENQLEALINVKSKDELVSDIIGLLQSPLKMSFLPLNQAVVNWLESLKHYKEEIN